MKNIFFVIVFAMSMLTVSASTSQSEGKMDSIDTVVQQTIVSKDNVSK